MSDGPRSTFLGRDDVNDVESILADDDIDFGECSHSQPVGGDAIFTWDYDRTRPALAKLYERAKVRQWNANDLPWDTDVDVEGRRAWRWPAPSPTSASASPPSTARR